MKNGDMIPIETNVEPTELEFDLIAKEPLLWYEPEFQKELVIEGMKREIDSTKDFDVYDEVKVDLLTPEELKNCIPTRWVHKPKGLAIKSRIVVKGYKEIVDDKDDTYASTPSVITLRLLLVLALAKNWYVLGADVSTAFLHATWTKATTYVWPPEEFYPGGGVAWRLKKALYGLKSSPKLWQTHFATTMAKFDFVRCKSDSNLHKHVDGDLFVLCYVDDMLIVGKEDKAKATFDILSTELLMKSTGTLSKEGDKLDFLGRQLSRSHDSIFIGMDDAYVAKILAEANMSSCRPANTPGTDALKRTVEEEEELDALSHREYRKVVGQLLWLTTVRPDLAYAVKDFLEEHPSPHLSTQGSSSAC